MMNDICYVVNKTDFLYKVQKDQHIRILQKLFDITSKTFEDNGHIARHIYNLKTESCAPTVIYFFDLTETTTWILISNRLKALL